MKNNQISRYVVQFTPRFKDEDNYDNYTSYSTKLDNIQGMTKAYSQAVASADKYYGRIYADYGDGHLEELNPRPSR